MTIPIVEGCKSAETHFQATQLPSSKLLCLRMRQFGGQTENQVYTNRKNNE